MGFRQGNLFKITETKWRTLKYGLVTFKSYQLLTTAQMKALGPEWVYVMLGHQKWLPLPPG